MRKHFAAAAAVAILCAPGAALSKLPPIPRGNHYVCYPAATTDVIPQRIVQFKDQFGTWKVEITGITRLCAPASKATGNAVFPVIDPALHLVCYSIKLASQNHLPTVITNDQFGGHINVKLKPPTEACLPAGKIKLAD